MTVKETIALLGENVCLEAYTLYESSGNGANTICQDFESRIIDAIEDSGYPLRDGGLSHGGLTVWGDAMIDAGEWLVMTSGIDRDAEAAHERMLLEQIAKAREEREADKWHCSDE